MEGPEAVPAQEVGIEAQEETVDEPAVEPAGEPPATADEAPAEQEAPAAEQTAEKKKAARTPAAKPKATPASEADTGTGARGRRERKQVERFQPVAAPKKEADEVAAVGAGSGTKLRDIPNVAFKMGKLTGRDELIEALHNVLFRRKGTANLRKKAVLDFSGFAFAEEAKDKEVEARRASLGKLKLDLLHRLMDVLDLQRGSGDKAAKVEKVLEFLQEPKALSDVDLAAKEAGKKEKAKRQRERAAAKKEKEKGQKEKAAKRKSSGAAGGPAKKAKRAEEGEGPEEEPEEEGEEESEAEVDEGEESDEEKLPAKKDRRGSGGRQRGAPAEAAAEPMEDDDEGEQDPATKVDGADLKAAVEGVLQELPREQLAAITTKPLLRKLEEKYGFSLKPRKEEVIGYAQAYVQAYLEANPEAGADTQEEEEQQPTEKEEAAAAEEAPAEPEAAPEAEPAAEEAPAEQQE